MIKAIIFDFYGVIRSNEYHDWLKRHDIKRADKFKGLSASLDKGQTTIDQFFERLSKLSNIPANQIREEFSAHSSLNEQLLALILELKKKYKIALLSNASSSYLRDTLDSAGISKLFDEIIISSEVSYIKPSNKIFEYTLDKLGVKPNEAIFIDDNDNFCQAAEQLGMKGICYTDLSSLSDTFKEMRII